MPRDTAGLGSSPFDRLYWGNRYYFLLLRVLRCFSSPRSPHAHSVMSGSLPTGCPIRISWGLRVFAPRPGFSQLVTSFFASESLGIPHAPLCQFRFSFSDNDCLPVSRLPVPSQWARDARLLYSFVSRIARLRTYSIGPQLPSCPCALPVVVLGRVELPTSTLSV